MLHDDLTLYTNKEYRSSHYLEKCWSLIEEKILFFIGFINKPMLSIKLESDCICLTIMNKEKIIYKEVITKNFSHSLNLCEDFIVYIKIDPYSEKYSNVYNCIYSFVKDSEDSDDEGVISFVSSCNLTVNNYKEIKDNIILNLCLESQYAINKNIFCYNISKKNKKADVDAYYELVKFKSKISKFNFNSSLNYLISNKLIPVNIYNRLLLLNRKLEEKNV